jgi:hypothetical protein
MFSAKEPKQQLAISIELVVLIVLVGLVMDFAAADW